MTVQRFKANFAFRYPKAINDIFGITYIVAIHAVLIVYASENKVTIFNSRIVITILAVYYIVRNLQSKFGSAKRQFQILLEKWFRKIVFMPGIELIPRISIKTVTAINFIL
ncbi:hypothetical protein A3I34_00135 [Candidatus Jorgensenbacteria bacterium RIFCSPLOWO2_02_FULL_45_12]|uniref:Uncharacterized protein n=1 Tax=Candidatus Jorgensenbacteria bacterium RIFCSPHIGHO2_02_FULL_45_20 TaxID=1798470 RepID=A0A1F6BNP4_9BACT|nr:MAG: hypothetical protein A2328_02730 [Bdellovibrionales bacterium RIFOXYB2_FULL_36_6]OGG38498.1 MAG: hypothetical protein A3D55_02225 [Candidatus Jorgensenbacteria bacterium RIFCSPHIGHO2_02_FULL_45_20]OGG42660.1 MAG: hypothetical protein A3I34_00135 [Candidatus Jorgensenbacteria bacterium RIFCSPLOWO2_02_FULL_45_12]